MRQFLKYMECSTQENAVTEKLRQFHAMVERVKHDEEVSVQYMRIWEWDEEAERECAELRAIIDGMKAKAEP